MIETDKVSEALNLGSRMMQVVAWEDFITYSYKTIHLTYQNRQHLFEETEIFVSSEYFFTGTILGQIQKQ